VTSIFILGFVVGPLLWAPCSESFGRRIMFIATFIPFTVFNAACCGAHSLEVLLVFRFLSGTFGSSSLTSVGYVPLPSVGGDADGLTV
jgi:MFS family permease